MTSELLTTLTSQLNNQFVGGGLILMLSGAVMALLRRLPSQIYGWLKRRLTVSVEISNQDPLFDRISIWLDAHPYSKKSRTVRATTAKNTSDDDEFPPHPGAARVKRPRVIYTPAMGQHLLRYAGKFIWLERSKGDSHDAPAEKSRSSFESMMKPQETYEITVIGRSQSIIRALIEEVIDQSNTTHEGIHVYNSAYGYWQTFGTVEPRKFDSVILPAGAAEGLRDDAVRFMASRERYNELGIPWHRGYLLHGLPGTGKTSIVTALAGELKMNLYLLNLGSNKMGDEKLSDLMSNVQPYSIVLMEDIDCTQPSRKQKASKDSESVTMSGLLNCLDGLISREGCLIFMTTNHKDQLDSALLRPGRVDVQSRFGVATEEQICRFYKRIKPDDPPAAAIEFARQMVLRNSTMAEIQQHVFNGQEALLSMEVGA